MDRLTTKTVQIRTVEQEDFSTIYELEEACFKDPFPSYFIRQLAEANPDTFLVAVDSGRVVGYGVVDDWTDHQHLVSLAVLADCRRRGIGQALLDRLIEQSTEGPLRLELRKSNKAGLALYLKNGFSQTGVAHNYYSDGEDAVRMERIVEKKLEVLAPA